ncbi:MAG: UDP-2,3-diacylglucosamine diphosphatase [Gammaproteobacteria bacterium]|nr:UDP-2,3-diacylglucosamine diphosphatase [Gammaproteobacteria bacterium]
MSKILFISDLHLAPERPDIIQLFIKFLDEQASAASALYILGDLVEYWLGDDDQAAGLDDAFGKLKETSDKGINIYLMHGNRDFLMGERLANKCGCTLIHEPYIADLNKTPALLLHGDTLCTDDTGYQQLRQMLRNPAWQKDFLAKPLTEREQMAQALREQSKQETQSKSAEIMDVNADAVAAAFKDHGISLIIHGHTHRPDIHYYKIDNRQLTRIVLGDWYKSGNVLEFEDINNYRLREFN